MAVVYIICLNCILMCQIQLKSVRGGFVISHVIESMYENHLLWRKMTDTLVHSNGLYTWINFSKTAFSLAYPFCNPKLEITEFKSVQEMVKM